jgi:hypothetical protein
LKNQKTTQHWKLQSTLHLCAGDCWFTVGLYLLERLDRRDAMLEEEAKP